MTVLESDSRTRTNVILPFDRERAARQNRNAALFCPNITSLPLPVFQKADKALVEMNAALLAEDAEAFNEARQQITTLIKKHGEPITQWNPLILELLNPDSLRGLKLPGINFNMCALRSSFGRVSLEGTNLQNAGFLCADLSQVVLNEADLSGADLRFADLREASLERALLVSADLSNAKLSFTRLNGASFYCARLNGAVIKQASLQEINLRKADLRNTDFYQSDLRAARLQHADLRESNLFMADFTGARLRHADLRKAQLGFCCLKEVRMQHARLCGANFTSADLTGADLQYCKLTTGQFSRAAFESANLNQTDLSGADLSEALSLETASLQNALLDTDTRLPKGVNVKKQARFHRKRFSISKLLSALFSQKPRVEFNAP